jgi:uncharacterized membrane protein
LIISPSPSYWFFGWNLFLAWLPLVFAGWLVVSLYTRPWLSWLPLLLTTLWLMFLPNSFYIVSDLIHLSDVDSHLLFVSVLIESFILNGLILGYLSLYLVHIELIKRIKPRSVICLVGAALLVCSFAIYLGRDLRGNSWDLLVSPAGILFDISDTFIQLRTHIQAFTTTLMFFVLLTTFYIVLWRLRKLLQPQTTHSRNNTHESNNLPLSS